MSNVKFIARTGILLALALGFQSLGLAQPITGPVVNAILYIAAMMTGGLSGVVIGLTTPWIAYITGIMKLAPAVPVIIAGNVTLVITYVLVSKVNKYAALALAAVAKWLVMTAGIKYLLAQAVKLPPAVVTTLTIAQLWTALGGAVIALLVGASLENWQKNRKVTS